MFKLQIDYHAVYVCMQVIMQKSRLVKQSKSLNEKNLVGRFGFEDSYVKRWESAKELKDLKRTSYIR